MKRKEELKKEIEELIEWMNDEQHQFINDYMMDYKNNEKVFTSLTFIDDAVCEYADNGVSVYYSDQIAYYREHTSECMSAFREYGYDLKNFDDLEEAIAKAGVCGWYQSILDELYEGNRLYTLNDLIEELEDLENE